MLLSDAKPRAPVDFPRGSAQTRVFCRNQHNFHALRTVGCHTVTKCVLLRRTNRAPSLTIPFDFYQPVDNSTSVRNSFHTKEIQVGENKIF